MRKKVFPKGIRASLSSKKKMRGKARTGSLYLIAILFLITAGGVLAIGGATPDIKQDSFDVQSVDPASCCDSGSGSACRALNDQLISYAGQDYGLLKSNIIINSIHLHGSNEFSSDGQRIFINSSDMTADFTFPGCEKGKDLIKMSHTDKFPQPCMGIPNDEIVYVCTSKDQCEPDAKGKTYDAYYRIADGPVPSPLAFLCPKPKDQGNAPKQEFVPPPQAAGRKNLQLESFQLKKVFEPVEWLVPYPDN
jgi:hypothetical protein